MEYKRIAIQGLIVVLSTFLIGFICIRLINTEGEDKVCELEFDNTTYGIYLDDVQTNEEAERDYRFISYAIQPSIMYNIYGLTNPSKEERDAYYKKIKLAEQRIDSSMVYTFKLHTNILCEDITTKRIRKFKDDDFNMTDSINSTFNEYLQLEKDLTIRLKEILAENELKVKTKEDRVKNAVELLKCK